MALHVSLINRLVEKYRTLRNKIESDLLTLKFTFYKGDWKQFINTSSSGTAGRYVSLKKPKTFM